MKPSGIKWHGSVGVTYHSRQNSKSISEAATQLFQALDPGDGVLVDAFVGPSEEGKGSEKAIVLIFDLHVQT